MTADARGFEQLSRDDCLRLLATTTIGRVGFHHAALPVVLPVAFVVDDGTIVIRTTDGSQLSAATRDSVVAFEADDVDPSKSTGWSVAATGRARHISDPGEVERARSLAVPGWHDAGGDSFVRIWPEALTGRRGRLVLGG